MPSLLDQMDQTELQLSCALLLAKAESLPKGDPERVKYLAGAKALLDKSASAKFEIGLGSKPLKERRVR